MRQQNRAWLRIDRPLYEGYFLVIEHLPGADHGAISFSLTPAAITYLPLMFGAHLSAWTPKSRDKSTTFWDIC